MPWKNGRGFTLELATDAAVAGGDWSWRLSIADVPERAAFSLFPGVDRLLACLEGPGLRVERAGVRSRVPDEGDAAAFPGEEAAMGEPLGPGVRDINLMLRRDRWRGRMVLTRGEAVDVDAPVVLAHAAAFAGAAFADAGGEAFALKPGCTLVAGGRVRVAPAPGGAVVVCALRPLGADRPR